MLAWGGLGRARHQAAICPLHHRVSPREHRQRVERVETLLSCAPVGPPDGELVADGLPASPGEIIQALPL